MGGRGGVASQRNRRASSMNRSVCQRGRCGDEAAPAWGAAHGGGGEEARGAPTCCARSSRSFCRRWVSLRCVSSYSRMLLTPAFLLSGGAAQEACGRLHVVQGQHLPCSATTPAADTAAGAALQHGTRRGLPCRGKICWPPTDRSQGGGGAAPTAGSHSGHPLGEGGKGAVHHLVQPPLELGHLAARLGDGVLHALALRRHALLLLQWAGTAQRRWQACEHEPSAAATSATHALGSSGAARAR